MNYIGEFAINNNLRLGDPFEVDGVSGVYRFTENTLEVNNGGSEWGIANRVFMKLMSGELNVRSIKFPMINQPYYYVNHKGKVNEKIFKKDYIDVALVNFGNAFPSKSVAQQNSVDILGKIRRAE